MTRLKAQFTPVFARDVKRLRKKHVDDAPLKEVINLILDNTPDSNRTLYQRHNMHSLMGAWSGSFECHICNAGDWLLIWTTFDDRQFSPEVNGGFLPMSVVRKSTKPSFLTESQVNSGLLL